MRKQITERKRPRNYTVYFKTEENKNTSDEFKFLKDARAKGNEMRRQGRFVGLENINGIKLNL